MTLFITILFQIAWIILQILMGYIFWALLCISVIGLQKGIVKFKKEERLFGLPWGFIIVKQGKAVKAKIGSLKGKDYEECLKFYENDPAK